MFIRVIIVSPCYALRAASDQGSEFNRWQLD